MTLEECVGQLLCPPTNPNSTESDYHYALGTQKAGSIFVPRLSQEKLLELKEFLGSHYPSTLVNADLVYGPGARIDGAPVFPQHLAMGACGDPAKIRDVGRITAEEGRRFGIHWTFAPVVDLLVNPNNPCLNTRAFGEKPGHVSSLACSFIEGCQEEGRMAACAKHFPGDGIDDRDQHICTTVNSLSREEWYASYGKVWKDAIAAGVKTIMIGHLALPWKDAGGDWRGPPPATASRSIVNGLLREELGYQGVVVSDAMCMGGITSHTNRKRIAVEFIKAGGDVVLYCRKDDHSLILEAVKSGELDETLIRAAAGRVLQLKRELGLAGAANPAFEEAPSPERERYAKDLATSIARESVKVVRDAESNLPLKLPPKAKVAVVNIGVDVQGEANAPGHDHSRFAERLREDGYEVLELWNPGPHNLNGIPEFDAAFLNIFVTGQAKEMGSTRLVGDKAYWIFRSFLADELPKVVTSFGCPYKLYELPTAGTYINAHSSGHESQDAVLDVLFGLAQGDAKSPVSLKGFFPCEHG